MTSAARIRVALKYTDRTVTGLESRGRVRYEVSDPKLITVDGEGSVVTNTDGNTGEVEVAVSYVIVTPESVWVFGL